MIAGILELAEVPGFLGNLRSRPNQLSCEFPNRLSCPKPASPNVRWNGKGGFLARGWYVRIAGDRFGPYRTLTEAKRSPNGVGARVLPKFHRNGEAK